MEIFVRQMVAIPVKLTGHVDRFAPSLNAKNGEKGDIGAVEVEPQAEYWNGKTTWLNVCDLMLENGEPIYQDDLERLCRFAFDERDVAVWLCESEDISWDVAMIIASECVRAAESVDIDPSDFMDNIEKAGRLGDLCCGVSVWSILKDMENEDLEKVVEEVE